MSLTSGLGSQRSPVGRRAMFPGCHMATQGQAGTRAGAAAAACDAWGASGPWRFSRPVTSVARRALLGQPRGRDAVLSLQPSPELHHEVGTACAPGVGARHPERAPCCRGFLGASGTEFFTQTGSFERVFHLQSCVPMAHWDAVLTAQHCPASWVSRPSRRGVCAQGPWHRQGVSRAEAWLRALP